ncbi:MAG: hypothetical protein NTZ86_03155 [Legionellales bacterium]|nr:hypothetical protein [Legionellales bacterium]
MMDYAKLKEHFDGANSGQNEHESKSEEKTGFLVLNTSSPPPPGSMLILPSLVTTSSPIQELSKLSSGASSQNQSFQRKQFDGKQELELDICSKISDHNPLIFKDLDMLLRAERLLREAADLIGSPKPIRQFCGRVLMVLALAIATTVAAVAVMSMLGVATPAFLVPYLAAIQASSMVSTVLNFVAAKLTLDLNTAAAVTAMATAGTLGMFGKAVHDSGARTQLNCDLDRAAQALEAALSEKAAAKSM